MSVSDQLKRDVLVEGSMTPNLAQFQRDCLVAEVRCAKVEGDLRAGNVALEDDVKSKKKAVSLTADDGGVMDLVVKRL